jgi:tyrosyl-tRNA synthetase
MQGHDSVAIRADVELGGTEQLFNLMYGRELQQNAGQEPQVCLTLPILRGRDGVRKMGKSLDNYVGVAESAYEKYAKTMSIPDSLMREWFELLTDEASDRIAALVDPGQTHPMTAKKALASHIVSFYHGTDAAVAEQAEWERRFSEGSDPTDIPEVVVPAREFGTAPVSVVKLLTRLGLTASNGEARRLLGPNGGVNVGPDKTRITDDKATLTVTDGLIVRVGKRKIVRVRVTE